MQYVFFDSFEHVSAIDFRLRLGADAPANSSKVGGGLKC